MTIERTRQIFGDKMDSLSDDEVREFIANMGMLCDDILDTLLTEPKLTRNTGVGTYE